jgi:NADH dehydrogenase FAD-containing subunit
MTTVVLVGAGHAHLAIAKNADKFTKQGVRLLLVDAGQFWYSGLATGMLGGMYDKAEDQVDPERLIVASGGEFLRDKVVGADVKQQVLRLASGKTLPYDIISFNIGSQIDAGLAAERDNVWTVKPISELWRLRQKLEARFTERNSRRIVVIGGGPTGSEIAANLAALAQRHHSRLAITLVSADARLISQNAPGAAKRLAKTLMHRGIHINYQRRVTTIEDGQVVIAGGETFAFDDLILATGLVAKPLVCELGLPCDKSAGLTVTEQLHSIADPLVFAAGDCADIQGHPLPKLGVFGVRAAPILCHNLLAAACGEPLKSYRPQRIYLAILNLGDGTGLATWGPLWWQGKVSLWLKDWIDRRFLNTYRQA